MKDKSQRELSLNRIAGSYCHNPFVSGSGKDASFRIQGSLDYKPAA